MALHLPLSSLVVVASEQFSAASLSYTRLHGNHLSPLCTDHLTRIMTCNHSSMPRQQPDCERGQFPQRSPHAAVQRRAQLIRWEGRPRLQRLSALATATADLSDT